MDDDLPSSDELSEEEREKLRDILRAGKETVEGILANYFSDGPILEDEALEVSDVRAIAERAYHYGRIASCLEISAACDAVKARREKTQEWLKSLGTKGA